MILRELASLLETLWGVKLQSQKPPPWQLFASHLWTVEMLSLTLPGNGKATGFYYLCSSSKLFYFCALSPYCLFMKQYVYSFCYKNRCIFFLLIILVYILYIVNVKCSCMCKWVYFVFCSVCSVLVYHGYTNANMGEWGLDSISSLPPIISNNKFKLQSCYYIHFQTNVFGKGINSLIPPSYRLNIITTVLLQGWLRH